MPADFDLLARYQSYIDCLNRRTLDQLGEYVADNVRHNGRPFGLSGYREMLLGNYRDIPDLRFDVELLVCAPPRIASRLHFDCKPISSFLGLDINGRRVSFDEHAFYEFEDGKIQTVWSIVDKAAIEAQLKA